MTKGHVDHRYQQAEDAMRRERERRLPSELSIFSAEFQRIVRSDEYTKWARKKADQMTRICRRCQRLAFGAAQ